MLLYHLLAVLTIAVWGTTFVSTKCLLAEGLSPSGIFLCRFLLAYLCLAVLTLARKERRWLCDNFKDESLMMLSGITGGSLYFLAENTALQMALAGTVSLVVCLAPLLTAIFSCLIGKGERLSPAFLGGSLVAFAGVAFVTWGSAAHATLSATSWIGILLALLAAALWAVYQLVVKRLTCRYGVWMLTRKVFGYGILTILPFVIARPTFAQTDFSLPVVWGNLLFLGLIASFVCYAAWNKVIEHLGAVASANYIYLNPLVTCIASYWILHEHFTPMMTAGGIAIIAGLYLAMRARNR